MPITAQKDAPALKQAEIALAQAYDKINLARTQILNSINKARQELEAAVVAFNTVKAQSSERLVAAHAEAKQLLSDASDALNPIHAQIQQAHYVSDDKERAVAIVEAISEICSTFTKTTASQAVQTNGPVAAVQEDEEEDEPEEDEVYDEEGYNDEVSEEQAAKPWRNLTDVPLLVECYSSGDPFDPLERGWQDDDQCWFKDISTLAAYHSLDYCPSFPEFLWQIDSSLDVMHNKTAGEIIEQAGSSSGWRFYWIQYALDHAIYHGGELEPNPKRKES